jgi:glycosyltransferase involved in cell wall biosynthesis
MGYNIAVLKEYADKYSAEVHVIHWDHKKLTPFKLSANNNIYYYNRSDFSTKQLKEFVIKIQPDIVYISGWMDKGYLAAVRQLRKTGIPVVSGFDDIWFKTLRQRIASILFPLFRKMFFSIAWVSGPYQYEYVKRLGFKNAEIIHNLYSADLEIFNTAFKESFAKKKMKYPHRFLFAGRFVSLKGIDLLIKAWSIIKEQKKDWELYIIGNGPLHDFITCQAGIVVLDFLQPDKLAKEIEYSGCYILPSRFEPWALVLHEFSAAGLPIICSDICGAAPVFVTPGYNGFTFKSGNEQDLAQKMLRIINSSDDELFLMSENSHKIGQKITPEITAASFMSVLN